MRDIPGLTDKGELTELAKGRRISRVVPRSTKRVSAGQDNINLTLVVGDDPLIRNHDTNEPIKRVGVYAQNGVPEQGFVVYDTSFEHAYTSRHIRKAEKLRAFLTRNPELLLDFLQRQKPGKTTYFTLAQLLEHMGDLREDPDVKASLRLQTLGLYEKQVGLSCRGPDTYDGPWVKPGPDRVNAYIAVYAGTEAGREAYDKDSKEENALFSPLAPGCQIRAGQKLCDLASVSGSAFFSGDRVIEASLNPLNQAGGVFYLGMTDELQQRAPFVPTVGPESLGKAVSYVANKFAAIETKYANLGDPAPKYAEREKIVREAVDALAGR